MEGRVWTPQVFTLLGVINKRTKGGNKKRPRSEPWSFMGATGFEPVTPSVSSWCLGLISLSCHVVSVARFISF